MVPELLSHPHTATHVAVEGVAVVDDLAEQQRQQHPAQEEVQGQHKEGARKRKAESAHGLVEPVCRGEVWRRYTTASGQPPAFCWRSQPVEPRMQQHGIDTALASIPAARPNSGLGPGEALSEDVRRQEAKQQLAIAAQQLLQDPERQLPQLKALLELLRDKDGQVPALASAVLAASRSP